jgi:hypothetical protein
VGIIERFKIYNYYRSKIQFSYCLKNISNKLQPRFKVGSFSLVIEGIISRVVEASIHCNDN